MGTISKQWLQQKIAEMEATRDEIPFGLDEDDSNTLAAMRIALASLEALAVAYIIHDADARSRGEKGILRYFANISDEDINEYEITVTPLYTAPPAPVSVAEEATPENVEMLSGYVSTYKLTDSERDIAAEIWNACRAAMLKGSEPVATTYKLPEGWVAVPIEPTESMIVDGFESEPDEDFSQPEVWEEYQEMSGCQQAAHRAKLCWEAMIKAAPKPENI